MSQRITAANQGALLEAVNADPEFRLAARYWNGSFRLTMGPDEAYLFRVRDGELMNVNLQPTVFDAWDFEIAGSKDGWKEIFADTPRPFYQDVASALFRHGFTLGGDVESFFAYHAALRRVIALLRRPIR
ncbi:MAG: hypothetical protein ABW298_16150 [Candidatus Binatia bacterium]|jgi:hypothetical protein